jgi:hypothetical protein
MHQIFLLFLNYINLCSPFVLDYYASKWKHDIAINKLGERLKNNFSVGKPTSLIESVSSLNLNSDLLKLLAEQAILGENFINYPHSTLKMDKFIFWIVTKHREYSFLQKTSTYRSFSFDIFKFLLYVKLTLRVRNSLINSPKSYFLVQYSHDLVEKIELSIENEANLDYLKANQSIEGIIGSPFINRLHFNKGKIQSGPPSEDFQRGDLEEFLSSIMGDEIDMASNPFVKRAAVFYLKFRYSLRGLKDTDRPFYDHFAMAGPLQLDSFLFLYFEQAKKSHIFCQETSLKSYQRQLILNMLWEFLKNMAIYIFEKTKDMFFFERIRKAYVEFPYQATTGK